MNNTINNNLKKVILCLKETRKAESRVAITPVEVKKYINKGFTVLIETKAGIESRFKDEEYKIQGAEVFPTNEIVDRLKQSDILLRVKRPSREQECLIYQSLKGSDKQRILIGFLDPLDTLTPHVDEYRQSNLLSISMDNLDYSKYHKSEFESNTPDLNVLEAMSIITGRLAFEDCMRKTTDLFIRQLHLAVLGYGTCSKAAIARAIEMGAIAENITVYCTSDKYRTEAEELGLDYVNYTDDLESQRSILMKRIKEYNIVIAAARRSGHKASLIIKREHLKEMRSMSVVCDLARTEGGNVEGSKDDTTLRIESVLVTNTTGYPKRDPHYASSEYAKGVSSLICNNHELEQVLISNPITACAVYTRNKEFFKYEDKVKAE